MRRSLATLLFLGTSGCQLISGAGDPLPAASDAGSADAAQTGIPFVDEVLRDRPVAFYRFSTVSEGRCLDSSGNGKHVTLSCEFEYPLEPVIVKSVEPTIGLAGTEPRSCTFNLDESLDLTAGDFTYEMWVRLDGTGPLLSSRAASGTGPGILVETGGDETTPTLTFSRHGVGSILGSATIVLRGTAKHVVIVSNAGVPSVWANGLKAQGARAASEALGRRSIRVGIAEGAYGPIAIYDRALPDDRIVAHWRAGSGN
ncbi:MAG: hypothetical protein JST00_13735 [Deltaproteobacteria bacterium]|nr:hypothetical protein [Deltaproteobacteria bacterium]